MAGPAIFRGNEVIRMDTMQQVRQELEHYRKFFTIARLIGGDAIMRMENDLAEDPCPVAGESWKAVPCKNCIVRTAFQEKTRKTKLEYAAPDIYQVTAVYREVDGKPYVMELAQKLDDETLIDPEGSEKIMNKLLPYRDRFYRVPLTGAFNRRYYEDVVRNTIQPAGIAIMDLDDFKLYNDTFGHHAGDAALKTVVQIVQQNIRKSDSIIRYGGDEFLLVLPSIPKQMLQRKLQAICDQVHAALIPGYPNMQISVSIGGVVASKETVNQAMNRADQLLYRAKNMKNLAVTEYNDTGNSDVEKQRILIIDDSEMNRALLAEILGRDYEILEAENGQEGMTLLRQYKTGISLILLDIVMPMMNGFEVLTAMTKENLIENTPVIIISSADSEDVICRAYDLGASDYISRPFDAKIVYRRVLNTITLYARQRRLVSIIVKQTYEKERNNHMMISILSHIVEFRNGESGTHVLHMRQLTERIMERLVQKTDQYHLDARQRDIIATASALHDVGKIAIDESILNKPGRLTNEEFAIMKTHTVIGAEMLDNIETYRDEPLVRAAHDICRWHHERYDGRGYPDGLKGDDIPISAQIVALADVYDALVSKRTYKRAFPHEQAIEMILNGECGAFHPILLDCLRDIADELPQLEYAPKQEG